MATLAPRVTEMTETNKTTLLLNAAVLAGCKAPSGEDYRHIMTAVEEKFQWVTGEEFLLAFRLNSYGDLEQRIEHFNLFSMDFVVRVISAYEKHRGEAVLKSAREQAIEAAKEVKPTEEQIRQSREQAIEDFKKEFQAYKKDKSYKIKNQALKYDMLQRYKLVPVISEEKKQEYLEKAKEYRFGQIKSEVPEGVGRMRELRTLIESHVKNTLHSSEQAEIRAIAKSMALYDWMDGIVEFNK